MAPGKIVHTHAAVQVSLRKPKEWELHSPLALESQMFPRRPSLDQDKLETLPLLALPAKREKDNMDRHEFERKLRREQ